MGRTAVEIGVAVAHLMHIGAAWGVVHVVLVLGVVACALAELEGVEIVVA